MCGIIGFFNSEKDIRKGLDIINHRGRDANNIVSMDNCAIGHCLHAINNFVEQPLQDDRFVFTANCEIYNWEELDGKLGYGSKNDAELLFNLLKNGNDMDGSLKDVDGVYAFSLFNKEIGKVMLARDIIGVKPVWYYYNPVIGEFAYASEKKALKEYCEEAYIYELNPRKILIYDLNKKEIGFVDRDFFELGEEVNQPKSKLKKLLRNAIVKRATDKKIGLLLSGGVDSCYLALKLKELGIPFTCYTAALEEEGLKESEDLKYAEEAAVDLGVELKKKKIKLKDVPKYLEKLLPLIEDNNVVKAGVAIPFYLSAELARKDGCKVLFSGLGSEEIFAGYERHRKGRNVNEECISGLRKMYERDLYRDDVITMSQSLELRLPYLDKELVEFALNIEESQKLDENESKKILREIALEEGLPEKYAYRKKKAAQYGSNFDKAIAKLAKKENKNKSEYLKKFYNRGNSRLVALISTGKDSCLATQIMLEQNYEVSCFATLTSENSDSYMYHGPNTSMAELQSEASNIPLLKGYTKGEKEEELEDLKNLLHRAVEEYKVEGVVTGAIFSNYQRERVERVCEELGLKCYAPLWHMDQGEVMKSLLDKGFEFCIVKTAAYGLNEQWLGKKIGRKEVMLLKHLNKRMGFNIAGEGGEYETLVLKAPYMDKRIKIKNSIVKKEDEYCSTLNVLDAVLE